MNEKIELNIQPGASILGVFSRLNYKPWYAIAEFVDNSTASFFENERTMKFYKKNVVTVDINYDSILNEITIVDDAYGMEIEDFKRAILLDSKPIDTDGRNEFGMGLKTAASWFGNVWSVESTQLNSTNRYFAEINIPDLKEKKLQNTTIIRTDTKKESHGTTIKIRQLTKRIGQPKKIMDILRSMYRRDMKKGNVKIYFNGTQLFFDDYKPLIFREIEWREELDFKFDFEETTHHVTGFIGILESGSYSKAGISLFRRNRVVIGGEGLNYTPSQIYVQKQSQIALKLYGELNLDTFPVNQAKDGFLWDDGLEDKFIEALKAEIREYIDIANMSTKDRLKEESFNKKTSDTIKDAVENSFKKIKEKKNKPENYELQTKSEMYNTLQEESMFDESQNFIVEPRSYDKLIHLGRGEYLSPIVYWESSQNEWFKYNRITGEIYINIEEPLFKEFIVNDKFKETLEILVITIIAAEEKSIRNANKDGYVFPTEIRRIINEILREIK